MTPATGSARRIDAKPSFAHTGYLTSGVHELGEHGREEAGKAVNALMTAIEVLTGIDYSGAF
jgi:hypothetical protein